MKDKLESLKNDKYTHKLSGSYIDGLAELKLTITTYDDKLAGEFTCAVDVINLCSDLYKGNLHYDNVGLNTITRTYDKRDNIIEVDEIDKIYFIDIIVENVLSKEYNDIFEFNDKISSNITFLVKQEINDDEDYHFVDKITLKEEIKFNNKYDLVKITSLVKKENILEINILNNNASQKYWVDLTKHGVKKNQWLSRDVHMSDKYYLNIFGRGGKGELKDVRVSVGIKKDSGDGIKYTSPIEVLSDIHKPSLSVEKKDSTESDYEVIFTIRGYDGIVSIIDYDLDSDVPATIKVSSNRNNAIELMVYKGNDDDIYAKLTEGGIGICLVTGAKYIENRLEYTRVKLLQA